MSETQFVDGLRAYRPHERAPDFVKANLKVDRDELIEWLKGQPEIVRIDIKESRGGNYYAAVNDYKPKADDRTDQEPFEDSPIPF